jgi:GH25 family lysozyme M1 (1,4-beta-N-acetylmuramidase)
MGIALILAVFGVVGVALAKAKKEGIEEEEKQRQAEIEAAKAAAVRAAQLKAAQEAAARKAALARAARTPTTARSKIVTKNAIPASNPTKPNAKLQGEMEGMEDWKNL